MPFSERLTFTSSDQNNWALKPKKKRKRKILRQKFNGYSTTSSTCPMLMGTTHINSICTGTKRVGDLQVVASYHPFLVGKGWFSLVSSSFPSWKCFICNIYIYIYIFHNLADIFVRHEILGDGDLSLAFLIFKKNFLISFFSLSLCTSQFTYEYNQYEKRKEKKRKEKKRYLLKWQRLFECRLRI